MPTYKLLAISGSLRKGSYNTALLRAFIAQAPANVEIELADISTIPLYNQDDEANFPEAVTALKNKIKTADGILISTPEFNRSLSGVLKNMIDYTGRPYGDNAWPGKLIYVVGASSGPIGTAVAQYDLKRIMLYSGAYVLGQPEFYCRTAQDKFNEAGELRDEETKKYIDAALTAFAAFIDKLR